ncbi:MAG: phosphotransferase [Planctomycetota bacterium]
MPPPSPPTEPPGFSTHAGDTAGGLDPAARQAFGAGELAVVLSHYDLGVLDEVLDFRRGSRKSPKALIRSESGDFLLKRRAPGKDDAHKVAFCHGVQLHLADKGFPLPRLVGTRRSNNSMLRAFDSVYELFEFLDGARYDGSLEATHAAGRTLAQFHELLADHKWSYAPPAGSYHRAKSVRAAFEQAPQALDRLGLWRPESQQALASLDRLYDGAATHARQEGVDDWPKHIAHCDWHPGNLLFRKNKVLAVLDYDAARVQPRLIDVANGALQFSMRADAADAADWPSEPDLGRFRRFLRGYDEDARTLLSRAELRALPSLMIEAAVAQGLIPIAVTGRVSRLPGDAFLLATERKCRWIYQHAQELTEAAES